MNRRGLGVDWGAASVGCFSGFGLNIWSLEETCSWFMSPTAQRMQGFTKKTTTKTATKTDKETFFFWWFFGLSFGDSVFDCLCFLFIWLKSTFSVEAGVIILGEQIPVLREFNSVFWWLDHQNHRNCCEKSPQLSPLNHPYFLILSHHHPYGRHVIPLIAKKQRFVLVKSNMVVVLVM